MSLYGEVQKDVLGSLLESDYGVPVTFWESTPICIERLLGTGADAQLIVTPPNPFLATVGLRVEPAPIGAGITIRLEVELGSMPSAFFTAVQESVLSTLRQGPHGWEIPDCVVSITHSGYWGRHSIGHAAFTKSISSTAADYRCLAPLVLMTALERAGTRVCVPVHRFELEIPERQYASVLAALPRLSATPLDTQRTGDHLAIRGTVPAVAVHSLQQRVPDLTSGEGLLTTRLDHFAPRVGPAHAAANRRRPDRPGQLPQDHDTPNRSFLRRCQEIGTSWHHPLGGPGGTTTPAPSRASRRVLRPSSGGFPPPTGDGVRRNGPLLVARVVLLDALVVVFGSVMIAKVLTELALFVASFVVQRVVVFRRPSVSDLPRNAALVEPADAAATR